MGNDGKALSFLLSIGHEAYRACLQKERSGTDKADNIHSSHSTNHMVTIKSSKGYLCIYDKGKFVQYLGKEENYTPEKLNYLKRKIGGKIKC